MSCVASFAAQPCMCAPIILTEYVCAVPQLAVPLLTGVTPIGRGVLRVDFERCPDTRKYVVYYRKKDSKKWKEEEFDLQTDYFDDIVHFLGDGKRRLAPDTKYDVCVVALYRAPAGPDEGGAPDEADYIESAPSEVVRVKTLAKDVRLQTPSAPTLIPDSFDPKEPAFARTATTLTFTWPEVVRSTAFPRPVRTCSNCV